MGTPLARVDRRAFLRLATGGAVGVPLWLAACTPSTPAVTSGTSNPTRTAATGRLKLPTYTPIQVAKPDLPATPAGLDAAYFTYPRNLVKSVPQVPGTG